MSIFHFDGSGYRKIYIYKVVILFVCLPGCPNITHEPLDRFASNFDYSELGRPTGMQVFF